MKDRQVDSQPSHAVGGSGIRKGIERALRRPSTSRLRRALESGKELKDAPLMGRLCAHIELESGKELKGIKIDADGAGC